MLARLLVDRCRPNDSVSTGVGLSNGCSECWVAMGDCILAQCKICAVEPKGGSCSTCSEQKCFPSTVDCTGIPVQFFPGDEI